MVRGIGAPADLFAFTVTVARAGIGFTTVICARPERAMREAAKTHRAVRIDGIRCVVPEMNVRSTRRRPVCVKRRGIAKMPETFALLHDTKEWNLGKLRCASDRKDGWAEGDQPL